jgi:hypothetical protein
MYYSLNIFVSTVMIFKFAVLKAWSWSHMRRWQIKMLRACRLIRILWYVSRDPIVWQYKGAII